MTFKKKYKSATSHVWVVVFRVYFFFFFRSTAHLESFQNHILMYASKRQAFTPRVYDTRVVLAALDYNFHRERPTYRTAEGHQVYVKLSSKFVVLK